MRNRADDSEYRLAWSEEFTGDSLSSSDWNMETRQAGWVNNELQEYVASDETIYVRDGKLHIRPVRITDRDGNYRYYSGRINTKGKHEFLYGRFEASIKVPKGKGFLPAFWLLPDETKYRSWPVCGEIDIMEVLGHDTEKVYGTIHYGEKHIMKQGINAMIGNVDLSEDFHIYSCEWDPGQIKFLVDGIEYFRVHADDTFTHPFFIIINLAVGGDWPGDPDMDTPFDEAGEMVIDYVKVYRKETYKEGSFGARRGVIGVCGVWEDADNLNMFMRSMQTEKLFKDYVLCCYTFGLTSDDKYNLQRELEFADFICSHDHDAMIVFGEMIKTADVIDRLVLGCKKKDIPLFMFERDVPGTIHAQLQYEDGFEKAVRHIVEDHGIKDVEMFAGFRGNSFSDARIEVFRKVLEENGIEFSKRMIHYGDFWDATASQVLSGLIDSGYRVPRALVCANDSMAIGICDCLVERGYRVPEDVYVTGFDGIKQALCHNPVITTCVLDYEKISDEILERIREWKMTTDHAPLIEKKMKIDYRLSKHTSCGCSPGNDEDWSAVVSEMARDNHDYFRHMLEMGKFISRSISMTDVDDMAQNLKYYLWLWKDQYYFIALQEGTCLHALFESMDGEYRFDQKFFNMPDMFPEADLLLSRESKYNVFLIKQTRSGDVNFGYVVNGYDRLDMRKQQRFEEFALFISATVNTVLNNRHTQETVRKMEEMSELDYLTGLYNRRGFFSRIDRILSERKNKGLVFSLFSVDMDGLKYINDNFGHTEGDNAIQVLARAISKYVGERGVCARYGGDEFAFAMISEESMMPHFELIKSEIRRNIDNDGALRDKDYGVDASMGMSECTISRGLSIENMIKESDEMMYQFKRKRKAERGEE